MLALTIALSFFYGVFRIWLLYTGTVLLVISGIGWILAPLLFAIIPEDIGYWRYIFPAMICGTLGVDVTYNVTNVFVTTSLPERQQGLAATVANSVLSWGLVAG
jgi:hypothetical protein